MENDESPLIVQDVDEKKEESLEPTISVPQVKGKKKKRKSQIVPKTESDKSAENVEEPFIATKDDDEKKEESLEPTISASEVKGRKKKRKSQIVPKTESNESAENVGSEEPSLIVT